MIAENERSSSPPRPHRARPAPYLLAALAAAVAVAPAGGRALTLEEAVRMAWAKNPGLAAGAEQARAARASADAARDARLPTVTLKANGILTDEPMMAFGIRLNEQKVTAADFAPDRLNAPDPIGGIGLGASLMQPLYMGGRLTAGRRAATAQAEAEASAHERRRDELALAVVETYFGAQVAEQGLRHAEEQLQHALETERFARARHQQGLTLEADVARATAFRAQSEAERASAAQRLASARSALVLLAGDGAASAELTTPLATPGTPSSPSPSPSTPPSTSTPSPSPSLPATPSASSTPLPPESPPPTPDRPDLTAARLRATAAEEARSAARGALLPEVFAQVGVETLRASLDQGATWFSLGLVARWQLSLAEVGHTRAAEARAAAASAALAWQERQARREVEEARRAIAAADSRVASAHEAVAASEMARGMREARHRQGLLPLTDVLDAEAALTGARALLLRSQLEARVARAQLELALGQSIEGVKS